jgi:hypothetical protein
VVDSDEHMISVLQTLEQCRATLHQGGQEDTAQLVSVAILDLRMRLKQIGDAELRVLCEEMMRAEVPGESAAGGRSAPRRHPLLRVVK